MKNTKIITAFPACGKSWVYEHQEELNIKVLDSDSSTFSWMWRRRTKEELATAKKEWESVPHLLDGKGYVNKIKDELIKVRNPDFPKNYIKYIKENIGKYDYIFVSTHEEVRRALAEANIDFTIVFPRQDLKAEWVGRCFLRGSGETFCKLIADNWDTWILQLEEEGVVNLRDTFHLQSGEYLDTVLKFI